MLTVVEAYARLKSIRVNLPDQPVPPHYVAEYHDVLDLLELAPQVRLQGFRIPPSEVRPVEADDNRPSGQLSSRQSYCDRSLFLMKVDAVLTMFELLVTPPDGSKLSIRFRPPT